MTRATIISDASYDHRADVAAWAGWVRADGRSARMFSAPIKRKIANSTQAEICAIANTLAAADAAGLIDDGMEVMLQSDCTVALGWVLKLVPGVTERRHADSVAVTKVRKQKGMIGIPTEAAAVIAKIAAARGLIITVRHVRGHKAGDGRQYVNRLVDKAARKHVRTERARPKPKAVPIEEE